MSACSLQAVSQSGWRLMVASSAKISRPRSPAPVAGPRLLTLDRNASISVRDDVVAGSPARRAGVASRGLSAIEVGPQAAIPPEHKVGISGVPRNGP
jgi:hypothetical protein